MATTTRRELHAAALHGDLRTFHDLFQRVDVCAGVTKCEALIAAAGRDALRPNVNARLTLRRALIRQSAWFLQHRRDGGKSFYSASGPSLCDTLTWLFAHPTPIPYTLGFLIFRVLRHAVYQSNTHVVELLLSSWTFQVFLTDEERKIALSQAVQKVFKSARFTRFHGPARADTLELLLAHGADLPSSIQKVSQANMRLLQTMTTNGAAPQDLSELLPQAVRSGESLDFVRGLVQLGLVECSPDGSLVHLVTTSRYLPTGELLLSETFLDVDARDSDSGMTGLMLVIQGHRTQYTSDSGDEQRLEQVQYLLLHGADVNAQNNIGETAVMFCVRQGLVQILEELLEHGADPSLADAHGRTPLHGIRSCPRRLLKTATLLLNYGAHPMARTTLFAETPLHAIAFTVASRPTHSTELKHIAALLIAHGADPNARNSHAHRTPLHSAVRHGQAIDFNVLATLVDNGGELFCSDDTGESPYGVLAGRADGKRWLNMRGLAGGIPASS